MSGILNQSRQSFRCVGKVSEFDLYHEDCEVTNRETDEKMQSERIRGKITVNIGNGVKQFDVFCNRMTSKGEESKQWNNALSWLELTPEINSSITTKFGTTEEKNSVMGDRENASLILVNGRVSENAYYNSNTKDVSVGLRWNANRISTSRVSEDEEYGCTLNGNFFIKSVAPEVVNDEETGRLKVVLVAVDYAASPILINAFVEEDLAEAFEDCYEVGSTANFDVDVVSEHVGGSVNNKKMFGSSGKIKASGFDREILVIVGGEEAIEEPEEEDDDGNILDNGWIDPKAMKMALKERDTKLSEIKKNGEKGNSTASTTKRMSTMKKKKSKVVEPEFDFDDDDDNPFDDEEDF